MNGSLNVASLDAIFGAQQSGKSALMKIATAIAKPARLMIWDPKREYRAFGTATESLKAMVNGALHGPRFRIVFQPALSRKEMRPQFDLFCKVANHVRDCAIVVDELADVTEPGWAPEGWEIVTRQGRHAGLVIMGASQRPADVDKSFYGNATRVAVFRLQAEGDVDRMAKLIRRPRDEITRLAPLEYLDLDVRSGAVAKKKLTARDLRRIPA